VLLPSPLHFFCLSFDPLSPPLSPSVSLPSVRSLFVCLLFLFKTINMKSQRGKNVRSRGEGERKNEKEFKEGRRKEKKKKTLSPRVAPLSPFLLFSLSLSRARPRLTPFFLFSLRSISVLSTSLRVYVYKITKKKEQK
jgi:hypothetical protein